MFTMCAQIQDYLHYCEFQKNLNAHTLKAYRIDLCQFNEFIQMNDASLDKHVFTVIFPACAKSINQCFVKRKMVQSL